MTAQPEKANEPWFEAGDGGPLARSSRLAPDSGLSSSLRSYFGSGFLGSEIFRPGSRSGKFRLRKKEPIVIVKARIGEEKRELKTYWLDFAWMGKELPHHEKLVPNTRLVANCSTHDQIQISNSQRPIRKTHTRFKTNFHGHSKVWFQRLGKVQNEKVIT